MAEHITLNGRAMIEAHRKLVAAGRPLPIPSGRAFIADRSCVFRLHATGAIDIDHEAGTYWIRPGVHVEYRGDLLAQLKEAPIRSLDWPRFATSKTALSTAIFHLRMRGIQIVSERDQSVDPARGRQPVVYRYVPRGQ